MSDPSEVALGPSPAVRAGKDILFGSVAGMVSKVFEHPFDLTKVRLQSQVLDASARFNGPLDCLVQTYRNEGIRGLYRGLPAPVAGAMAENASLFLAYSEIQRVIHWSCSSSPSEDLTLPQLASAGAGAGAITSFVLTPIELVKCKMQVQMLVGSPTLSPATSPAKLPGPIAVVTSVVRQTGLRGLWLGHTGTFIRETGGTSAWFTTKEFVASLLLARRQRRSPSPHRLTKKDLRPWESALAGACSGAAFNLALFPADTVKSSVQTAEELRPGVPRPAFWAVAREMYAKQGVRGLYAGCGITVARSIPSSAIIFLIYDGLNTRFG